MWFIRKSLVAFQELLNAERLELARLAALRRELGRCQHIVERKWFNQSRWNILRTVDHFCRNPALGDPLNIDEAIKRFTGNQE